MSSFSCSDRLHIYLWSSLSIHIHKTWFQLSVGPWPHRVQVRNAWGLCDRSMYGALYALRSNWQVLSAFYCCSNVRICFRVECLLALAGLLVTLVSSCLTLEFECYGLALTALLLKIPCNMSKALLLSHALSGPKASMVSVCYSNFSAFLFCRITGYS